MSVYTLKSVHTDNEYYWQLEAINWKESYIIRKLRLTNRGFRFQI